jgi:hypothetical protein
MKIDLLGQSGFSTLFQVMAVPGEGGGHSAIFSDPGEGGKNMAARSLFAKIGFGEGGKEKVS